MGEDLRKSVYNSIMSSFKEPVAPEPLEKRYQVYSEIQGFEDACYDIAKETGSVSIDEFPTKVKYKLIQIQERIHHEYVRLPFRDQEIIAKHMKEDPKVEVVTGGLRKQIEAETKEETNFIGVFYLNQSIG